jgi:hypothetical protein
MAAAAASFLWTFVVWISPCSLLPFLEASSPFEPRRQEVHSDNERSNGRNEFGKCLVLAIAVAFVLMMSSLSVCGADVIEG